MPCHTGGLCDPSRRPPAKDGPAVCHCPLRQPVHRAQSRVCIEAGHVCLCNRRMPLTFLFGLLQMLLALSSVPPIGLGHVPPPPPSMPLNQRQPQQRCCLLQHGALLPQRLSAAVAPAPCLKCTTTCPALSTRPGCKELFPTSWGALDVPAGPRSPCTRMGTLPAGMLYGWLHTHEARRGWC